MSLFLVGGGYYKNAIQIKCIIIIIHIGCMVIDCKIKLQNLIFDTCQSDFHTLPINIWNWFVSLASPTEKWWPESFFGLSGERPWKCWINADRSVALLFFFFLVQQYWRQTDELNFYLSWLKPQHSCKIEAFTQCLFKVLSKHLKNLCPVQINSIYDVNIDSYCDHKICK